MGGEKKIEWDYRSEINKPILGSTFILSEPFMLDPSFSRSSCLIINHEKHEGTFGLIMNKLTDQKLSDIVKQVDKNWPIYYGGPVGTDFLYFIHNNSFNLSESNKIKDGLFWNGDFEELIEKINDGVVQEKDIRFFVGYSGWDSGQLRREIIENSWIVSNGMEEFIFKDPENIWKDILLKMDGVYKKFANFPLNPNLN